MRANIDKKGVSLFSMPKIMDEQRIMAKVTGIKKVGKLL
jgi:hypothetical protein